VIQVLVTGATGFVGRALCAEKELDARPCDLRRAGWERQLKGVEVVMHLAGVAHAQASDAVYEEVNVRATERLALAALDAGVRRLVYVSSIKVNGEATPPDRPFRASDAPAPQDEYGRSKWRAEQVLAELASLEVVIVRPPLVYGPGVRANFRRLLQLVDSGLPLPFGSIRNRRSFVFLGNLTALLRRCAEHPAAARRTFLAADGEDLSTPELVCRIGKALGRAPRLVPFPASLLPSRLSGSLVVDAGDTRDLLQWRPPYTVDEGLARTAAWYHAR
jgi:nucleoside-diphosphate-sugar epimerase